jgi:hypothetical protein
MPGSQPKTIGTKEINVDDKSNEIIAVEPEIA